MVNENITEIGRTPLPPKPSTPNSIPLRRQQKTPPPASPAATCQAAQSSFQALRQASNPGQVNRETETES